MTHPQNRKRILILTSLFLITILGFSLRAFRITQIPPGFFADEASIGYNAYTLVKYGADEEGTKLPVLFQNFGNFYRPGLSVYFSAPFVLLFGLNEWSVRIAAATAGTASIMLIFLVAKLLFDSNLLALASSSALTISPWHIHMSRIAQEFIYLPLFVLLSLFLFLYGLKKNSNKVYLLSFISLGMTLYTYVTAYFIVPFLIISLVIIYWQEIIKRKKISIAGFLLIFIIALPLVVGIPSGKTFSRFNQISVTTEGKTNSERIEKVTRTYLDHFSPSFLFLDGDSGYPGHFITRFSVKDVGQLFMFQLPIIIAGLVFLTRHFNKSAQLSIALLAIYPLGSTFAPFADGGGPFAMRSIMGVIPLHLLVGIGVYYIINNLSFYLKILVSIMILLISAVSLYAFLNKYFNYYSTYAADFWGWQYGAKGVMQIFLRERNNYDELFIEGKFNAPGTLIKFYDPENKCLGKCMVGENNKYDPNKKQFFAFSPELIQTISKEFDFYAKETVFYPNGTAAFIIGEMKEKNEEI